MNTQEYKIKGWVARDNDGAVFIHKSKPRRNRANNGIGFWKEGGERFRLSMFDEMFPDLSFDDEPIEVELTIKKI